MSVSGVGAAAAGTGAEATGTKRVSNQMDKMDFLQLLVTQLRYQDPMRPMDDRDFATQLAQFSSLDRMTEITKWSKMSYGLGLVGQAVQYTAEDGKVATGVVRALRMVDGNPKLALDDIDITIEQVLATTKAG